MSTQIRFNPKFSVEIADDVTIYKVFNNKLYVLLRRGAIVVDPEIRELIENDEALMKLLNDSSNAEEANDNLMEVFQKIQGITEVDIWKVYDISTIEGNKKLEDLVELETFKIERPVHPGRFYENAIISEKGISYLGYETKLIGESEPPKMEISDQVSQFGPIKSFNRGKSAEHTTSINFIYYDFEERSVKFLPEILMVDRPDVSVGSGNFLIKNLSRLSSEYVYLVDHVTGRCRKVVCPENIVPNENTDEPKSNPAVDEAILEITQIQKEIDRVTNHLTKINSIQFKKEIDDNDLNELIRHSVISYKNFLDEKQKNKTYILDKLLSNKAPKSELKKLLVNIVIDDNGLIHVIYEGNSFLGNSNNYTILTKNISDIVDDNEIVVEWSGFSKTNLNMTGGDRFSMARWFVAGLNYYQFKSKISFLEKTGKLYTFADGKNTCVSILDDNTKEIIPCEPDELYAHDDMILYHTHNWYFDETNKNEDEDDDGFKCNRKLFCYRSLN